MKHIRTFSADAGTRNIDRFADEQLVHLASVAMREKLAKKRKEGYGGWWRPTVPVAFLQSLLEDHVRKGDMVDIMNIAAMILAREEEVK